MGQMGKAPGRKRAVPTTGLCAALLWLWPRPTPAQTAQLSPRRPEPDQTQLFALGPSLASLLEAIPLSQAGLPPEPGTAAI